MGSRRPASGERLDKPAGPSRSAGRPCHPTARGVSRALPGFVLTPGENASVSQRCSVRDPGRRMPPRERAPRQVPGTVSIRAATETAHRRRSAFIPPVEASRPCSRDHPGRTRIREWVCEGEGTTGACSRETAGHRRALHFRFDGVARDRRAPGRETARARGPGDGGGMPREILIGVKDPTMPRDLAASHRSEGQMDDPRAAPHVGRGAPDPDVPRAGGSWLPAASVRMLSFIAV